MSADASHAAQPALSLVFPVFDEVESVGELIETALEIAARLALHFEIIVVDDGSRDGSGVVIDHWATVDPRV